MRKVQLIGLERPFRQAHEYVLDMLAQEASHELLRLTPYHCDLDPIEMIGHIMKSDVRQLNTSGHIQGVERLLLESRDATTTDVRCNCCRHLQELDEYTGVLEDMEPVVVSFITGFELRQRK